MITDELIIEEAVRLVKEGVSVTLPVNGNSMLPFIIGGKESVILQPPGLVTVGDVVLAWVENHRYVVHRIIRIDGENITLMGDGNIAGTEHCPLSGIRAKATHVVDDKGRRRYLYTKWRMRASRLWRILCPFRRYILAIYKRV